MKVNGRKLEKIPYSHLNARQQEQFNYQKASAVLAEYGFATFKIGDDWNGADFFAQHATLDIYLKVQLKGRLTFDKKYLGKNIYVMFYEKTEKAWYLYNHDEYLEAVSAVHPMTTTKSWKEVGGYSFPTLSKSLKSKLIECLIEGH